MRRFGRARATLSLHTYCGMSVPIDETIFRIDVGDLRRQAAQRLRRARRSGQQVNLIQRGRVWEFETPDDATMVSDNEALMRLCVPDSGMEGDERDDQNDLDDLAERSEIAID